MIALCDNWAISVDLQSLAFVLPSSTSHHDMCEQCEECGCDTQRKVNK